MPFSLPLPANLKNSRWKLKIYDQETVEPPHVTFIRGSTGYRWSLRDCAFLDEEPDPDDVPAELVEIALANLSRLIEEWDAMYPHNPVSSQEASDAGHA